MGGLIKGKVMLKMEGRENCLEGTSDFAPYSSLLVFCRWKEKKISVKLHEISSRGQLSLST